ncbi:hypothetical protein TrispH2_000829 [Trichoplax sp. H2]|nr:hypothetical protein TrispH2_000829 [Trichoplax sp. H2]|eukprot:RDD47521.1 hypothetical protein TrispH2_000829 [Trichoplax sp. H2]
MGASGRSVGVSAIALSKHHYTISSAIAGPTNVEFLFQMSENSNGYDYLIKLLALGDSGVGKTATPWTALSTGEESMAIFLHCLLALDVQDSMAGHGIVSINITD